MSRARLRQAGSSSSGATVAGHDDGADVRVLRDGAERRRDRTTQLA
jgi:hypothetical protein